MAIKCYVAFLRFCRVENFFLFTFTHATTQVWTGTSYELNITGCSITVPSFSLDQFTAWKVSVFGVILVRIFPHSDYDQNNSKYERFLRSGFLTFSWSLNMDVNLKWINCDCKWLC